MTAPRPEPQAPCLAPQNAPQLQYVKEPPAPPLGRRLPAPGLHRFTHPIYIPSGKPQELFSSFFPPLAVVPHGGMRRFKGNRSRALAHRSIIARQRPGLRAALCRFPPPTHDGIWLEKLSATTQGVAHPWHLPLFSSSPRPLPSLPSLLSLPPLPFRTG